MKSKKYTVIAIGLILVTTALTLGFYNMQKYWPEIAKKIYYLATNDYEKIQNMQIDIDRKFLFSHDDYSVEYRFENLPEPVSYCLMLELDNVHLDISPEQKLNCSSFTTDEFALLSKLRIELYKGNDRLFSSDVSNVYCTVEFKEERGLVKFVYNLVDLPYKFLKGENDKNKTLKVTVISANGELDKYADSATLLLVPDLRL